MIVFWLQVKSELQMCKYVDVATGNAVINL